MYKIKDLVSDGKMARFAYYRDRALHYETEDGFLFPVPIDDAGSATFNTEEKAILLMRYIRKQVARLEQSQGNGNAEGHS